MSTWKQARLLQSNPATAWSQFGRFLTVDDDVLEFGVSGNAPGARRIVVEVRGREDEDWGMEPCKHCELVLEQYCIPRRNNGQTTHKNNDRESKSLFLAPSPSLTRHQAEPRPSIDLPA